MSIASITVRVDDETKKRFEYICDEIGLTPTAAINTFIRAVLRENGIPISLKKIDPISKNEWMKAALHRKGIPIETVEADEHSNIKIDKEKHPDLHDWVVKG
ncbi:MAG: type II toxin-antitoxin system RelB/DinJ family antitoxin [Oscillospiraceae bacterium]|nr:type II toxin-antitoxin system RelB/DinJ family antitoxin [Oscillospiraceae bacterium]